MSLGYWSKVGLWFVLVVLPGYTLGLIAAAQTHSWWIGLLVCWMGIEVIGLPLSDWILRRWPQWYPFAR
ncbi:hypothetical protein Sulac_0387 [Sulfobacillus acidophilus DSM 10332]|uniref:Uncharacterized protein n=1 Tax=Sulfobacillus acidophilus (strain ATCC 700253 / DSM 10332 / NAL) TaxID=679936 RepID=G8TY47_SULAD|nr:hypothetical protein Sulac_0387 [Sulfobacillus acidophilus DSM 10332]